MTKLQLIVVTVTVIVTIVASVLTVIAVLLFFVADVNVVCCPFSLSFLSTISLFIRVCSSLFSFLYSSSTSSKKNLFRSSNHDYPDFFLPFFQSPTSSCSGVFSYHFLYLRQRKKNHFFSNRIFVFTYLSILFYISSHSLWDFYVSRRNIYIYPSKHLSVQFFN